MIKTPIRYSPNTAALLDGDGDVIGYDINDDCGMEIVRRVNMHGELVNKLKECAYELRCVIKLYNKEIGQEDFLDLNTVDECFKLLEKCKSAIEQSEIKVENK